MIDLRAARVNAGKTLTERAGEIGVNRVSLAHAEAGTRSVGLATKFKIAQFYGVAVTDLWPDEAAVPATDDEPERVAA